MQYVVWCNMYCINVPYIDDQHRNLLEIINRYHDAVSSGKSRESIFETLNALIKYTEEHFRDEEEIMALSDCPPGEIEEHKKLHEQLVSDIFRLHSDYANGKEPVVHDMELFLNDWLIKHILIADKKLTPYCKNLRHYERNRGQA